MKVVHIESGLGNQMLSYCEYLAMKKANPTDDVYIENIIYDIPECNDVICQWNGYELERVFGIKAPNIKEIFSQEEWNSIISDIRDTKFWEKNMNYPVYFTNIFKKYGIDLVNTFGDFEDPNFSYNLHFKKTFFNRLKNLFRKTYLFNEIKMWKMRRPCPMEELNCSDILFPTTQDNLFAGQKLLFKNRGSNIELIEKEIKESFVFPQVTDERNISILEQIENTESVAIHARRGDMLGFNYPCYATDYFKRCTRLIRKHTNDPFFYFFCDPGSVQWVKDNYKIFGISKKDKVVFVDWNKGLESFRDMQLMAKCKHQIITNSSFGWWSAWLNTNPNKITCSPDFRINTTNTI